MGLKELLKKRKENITAGKAAQKRIKTRAASHTELEREYQKGLAESDVRRLKEERDIYRAQDKAAELRAEARGRKLEPIKKALASAKKARTSLQRNMPRGRPGARGMASSGVSFTGRPMGNPSNPGIFAIGRPAPRREKRRNRRIVIYQ